MPERRRLREAKGRRVSVAHSRPRKRRHFLHSQSGTLSPSEQEGIHENPFTHHSVDFQPFASIRSDDTQESFHCGDPTAVYSRFGSPESFPGSSGGTQEPSYYGDPTAVYSDNTA